MGDAPKQNPHNSGLCATNPAISMTQSIVSAKVTLQNFIKFNEDQVVSYIKGVQHKFGLHDDVIRVISDEELDGETLMSLSESELKDMLKKVGRVRKLQRILMSIRENSNTTKIESSQLLSDQKRNRSLTPDPSRALSERKRRNYSEVNVNRFSQRGRMRVHFSPSTSKNPRSHSFVGKREASSIENFVNIQGGISNHPAESETRTQSIVELLMERNLMLQNEVSILKRSIKELKLHMGKNLNEMRSLMEAKSQMVLTTLSRRMQVLEEDSEKGDAKTISSDGKTITNLTANFTDPSVTSEFTIEDVDNPSNIDFSTNVKLEKGSRLDCRDTVGWWLKASVVNRRERRVCIHYLNWNSAWDEWLDIEKDSYRFAPDGKFTNSVTPGTNTGMKVKDMVSICVVLPKPRRWVQGTIVKAKSSHLKVKYRVDGAKYSYWFHFLSKEIKPISTIDDHTTVDDADFPPPPPLETYE